MHNAQHTAQHNATNPQDSENSWFASLLANLENKSLDQIAERLKDTPNYLEQIEFEHSQSLKENEPPVYAVKSAQTQLEEIMDKQRKASAQRFLKNES